MLFKFEYYVSRFGLRRVAVALCKAFSGVSLQSRFLLVLSMDLLFGWVSIFLCILDILFCVFVMYFLLRFLLFLFDMLHFLLWWFVFCIFVNWIFDFSENPREQNW